MKKFIYTLSTFVVLALGAVSCDSYFDVELQDQATIEEMFSKRGTARQLAAHMYAYLPKEENPVDATTEGGFSGRTDARQVNASAYANNVFDLRVGDYSPASITGYQLWENYYKAIAHCTLVIDNIHLDKEDNEQVRDYMKAEARFMRAFYYFCLFRTYGPVIIWGDQAAPSDAIGSQLDRNTLEENINFIVSELDKAIEVLPMSITEVGLQEGSDMGRATKGAAMALKSRVLLYAASPLYNGNELYAGMTNYYGKEIFPQTYDAKKWEEAKKAAKAVIDLNYYKLVDAGAEATGDRFTDGIKAYQNIFFEQWNDETIWGWWMNFYTDWLGRTGGFIGACAPRNITVEGWQSCTPSFKLVDAYAMYESGRYPVTGYDRTSGMDDYSKPIIDAQAGYEAEGFSMTTQYEAEWAGEFEAHNSTIGREPRYYASLVPNGYYWPCDPKLKTMTNPKTSSTTWTTEDMRCHFWRGSGSLCERWDQTSSNNYFGYAWRRLYKADNPLDVGADYQQIKYVYPAFRLAEIYFNYAECCIETGDYAEAVKYLNMIRNRSGLNNLEEAYPGISSDPELLRWCLRQEKMIEFAIEGPMHFYDSCRWMTAEENFPVLNWTLNLNDAVDYHDSWVRSSEDFPLAKHAKFTKRDYLFPLDSDQLAEMTNYTQNYGF